MVCLFDKTATEFDGNGICVLTPTECTVHEIAGGEYELHMEHPFDEVGRWKLIGDDSLIKAPVPPMTIPEITLPAVKVWSTVRQTNLYSKLPVYSKREEPDSKSILAQIQANPSAYGFQGNTVYNIGQYVTYNGWVFCARNASSNVAPGSNSAIWGAIVKIDQITPSGDSGGYYTPGTVAETLSANETIYKIADYNASYIQVRSLRGKTGYVAKADCQETQTTSSGEVIPEQEITEQVFRVYSIECEDDTQTVIVDAKHISYDFQGNALYDCQLHDADPGTALAILTGALMIEDDRTIACNVTEGKITQDWSFKNPINALLDPDTGLVPSINAKLIRNNGNFFILDDSEEHRGISINYGANMKGVRWTRSTENVVTRILPRCNDVNGGFLYLEDLFVDSEYISEYPFVRIMVLDFPYKVGETYEKPDGTKETRTEESCRAQMLEDAQKKFDEEKIDAVEVTLEVEFIFIGDTEEYKQYKGLEHLNIYDTVQVNTGRSNMVVTAKVTEYEWDCMRKRYLSAKFGTVNSFERRVPGFRITDQSIGYEKLSPALIQRIVNPN